MDQQRIDYDRMLLTLAEARWPDVPDWCGVRGGRIESHVECYVCDYWIDSWYSSDPMPESAQAAIEEHRAMHLAEMAEAGA